MDKFRAFFPDVSTWHEMQEAVNKFFKEKNYYITFGVTKPYVDMYLWKKQTIQKKLIELPDASIEIEICEMDEIVTKGWIDYLSLNKVSTGGWVTSNGTNYFKSSFDTTSDNFLVGLLKHEAQHFYDIKKYPNMQSADLEYRAKLVELINYKNMDCFFSFLETMGDDKNNNPHTYVHKKIIQALSDKVFQRELELEKFVVYNKHRRIICSFTRTTKRA